MNRSLVVFLALFVVACVWRVAAALDWTLVNFAPFTALAFCGAAFLRDRRGLALAAAALIATDLWINAHYASTYGYTWSNAEMLVRLGALAAAAGLGLLVARRRTALTLWGGSVAATVMFFLLTNSAAWLADPFYAKSAAGWWQALASGHPQFPPPVYFLRNALIGDLAFTGLCAVLAWQGARRASAAAA